ncbi:MAG: dihydroorotate dehydrogenase (quinone), partial [Bdellovibrionales bacterium]|nr:dihydroorotate dehydrogenase (quinone) [Bdellovibrionales bacterium]
MKLLWPILRSTLFTQDPEAAHDRVLSLLEGLSHSSAGRRWLRLLSAQSSLPTSASKKLWNLQFRTPVGLAAGFDKNGRLLRALPHCGFGFAEIGSVTPRAQPGNSKPRMSRDPSRQALWNAMGFNNEGAEAVARRLAHAREAGWVPSDFPVGVNLGKNKDTPNEQAHADYLEGSRLFLGLADYLVINVSSPNTPGLRAL